MDVGEYFPESISGINCDESRKEESTLHGNLHCHICYQELGDNLTPNQHFKPCKCPRIYVHVSCASRTPTDVLKCSMCGSVNSLSTMESEREASTTCVICNETTLTDSKSSVDSHMIRPCFCGVFAHYKCISPLIDGKNSCRKCGVTYSVFNNASTSSFICQYWLHFLCFMAILIIFVGLFVLAISNSCFITKRTDIRSILFGVWSIALFVAAITSVVTVLRYTKNIALPKYRVKYGSMSVHPFQAPILKDVQNRRFAGGVVAMSDVARVENGLSVIHEEDEEKSDSAHLDLTLGQHLFGVLPLQNRHVSSTPIEDSGEKFNF